MALSGLIDCFQEELIGSLGFPAEDVPPDLYREISSSPKIFGNVPAIRVSHNAACKPQS